MAITTRAQTNLQFCPNIGPQGFLEMSSVQQRCTERKLSAVSTVGLCTILRCYSSTVVEWARTLRELPNCLPVHETQADPCVRRTLKVPRRKVRQLSTERTRWLMLCAILKPLRPTMMFERCSSWPCCCNTRRQAEVKTGHALCDFYRRAALEVAHVGAMEKLGQLLEHGPPGAPADPDGAVWWTAGSKEFAGVQGAGLTEAQSGE